MHTLCDDRCIRLQEQSASTQQSLSAQLNTREDELAVALALADGLRDELRAETARRYVHSYQ